MTHHDSGDSSAHPSDPPNFQQVADRFLFDAVPPLKEFLTAIHEQFDLDPTMEAVLFGMIGKYLTTVHNVRLDDSLTIEEAHGYALNEVMSDPRIDRLVEEYTVGTTQFFLMKQFGVEVE